MHIIQFIDACYKFSYKYGITSNLIVEGENTIDDSGIFENNICNSPAGIIAEIDNVCGDTVIALLEYYKENNCKKELKQLNKMRIKHFPNRK